MVIWIQLGESANYVCDYTFNFHWHNKEPGPDSVIPYQIGTELSYRDLVNELKAGGEVHIKGNVGKNFAYSMGADLKHFGGSGEAEGAGKIFISGDAGPEAGMGMVAGTLYINGNIEQPLGNIIELVSDVHGYRKFRSVTDILCTGMGNDQLIDNEYNEAQSILTLKDGIPRGTLAARCTCTCTVIVEGNAYNGTGLLAKKCTIIVKGNAGMNTGSHLDGATVVVHGNVGEFAGAYMKEGKLMFLDAKGFIGAEMAGGAIYSKSKVRTGSPAARSGLKREDISLIRELMGAGRVESMLYNKYMPDKEKEKYVEVRMRDGSLVLRRID
jgi:formylmethanofuran dehydrogenase subunit C